MQQEWRTARQILAESTGTRKKKALGNDGWTCRDMRLVHKKNYRNETDQEVGQPSESTKNALNKRCEKFQM